METKTEEREEKTSTAQKTVIVRCIDCNLVIGTEKGKTAELEEQWNLCPKCVARRNGTLGAKTPSDLGIY